MRDGGKSWKRRRRLASQRQKMRELRVTRVAAGLCPDCGGPKGKTTLACDECAKKDRERMKGNAAAA